MKWIGRVADLVVRVAIVAAVCGRWLRREHSIVIAVATMAAIAVIAGWVAQDARRKERP